MAAKRETTRPAFLLHSVDPPRKANRSGRAVRCPGDLPTGSRVRREDPRRSRCGSESFSKRQPPLYLKAVEPKKAAAKPP